MTGVEQSIVLGSCHLEPFKEGASIRLGQTRRIVQAVPENLPFILAGDFNMRQDEDEKVENLGFQDAWKETGMDFSQKFTWDSYNNCYHAECYQFKCRFDRVYFKQGTNHMLSVKHFSLIGNKPLTNNKHFLLQPFGWLVCHLCSVGKCDYCTSNGCDFSELPLFLKIWGFRTTDDSRTRC
jgi:hypothetical protein